MWAARNGFLTAGSAGDPLWNYVSLLVQDGAGFGTPDKTGNVTFTAYGNAALNTEVTKYSSHSIAFDGNVDYLQSYNTTAFSPGTGDFTLELWVRLASLNESTLISSYANGGWELQHRASPVQNKGFVYAVGDTQYINNRLYATLNEWVHVALCRSGTTTRMFYNGVQQGAAYSPDTLNLTTPSYFMVGGLTTGIGQWFNGYIDSIRLTKAARYTANFDPPTKAFPVGP